MIPISDKVTEYTVKNVLKTTDPQEAEIYSKMGLWVTAEVKEK